VDQHWSTKCEAFLQLPSTENSMTILHKLSTFSKITFLVPFRLKGAFKPLYSPREPTYSVGMTFYPFLSCLNGKTLVEYKAKIIWSEFPTQIAKNDSKFTSYFWHTPYWSSWRFSVGQPKSCESYSFPSINTCAHISYSMLIFWQILVVRSSLVSGDTLGV
jgi:hypothetical protein